MAGGLIAATSFVYLIWRGRSSSTQGKLGREQIHYGGTRTKTRSHPRAALWPDVCPALQGPPLGAGPSHPGRAGGRAQASAVTIKEPLPGCSPVWASDTFWSQRRVTPFLGGL